MIGRTEEGCGITAGATVAAIVTGREAARRTRHVGPPPGDYRYTKLAHALLKQAFAATWSGRRLQELAARKGVRIIRTAAHANELFDLVVIRRDVGVRERPRNFPAIALRRLEIHLRVAEAHPAPDVRLSAVSPHTRQLEWTIVRGEVGLLGAIEEELWSSLATAFPFLRFPRPHVRPELRSIEAVTGIEQEDLDALARQVPGRHATRCSAADDDDRHRPWRNLMICMTCQVPRPPCHPMLRCR